MMIRSILETDLYKISVSNAYLLYPLAQGTFSFHDRAKENWSGKPQFMKKMRSEVAKLAELALTNEEKEWAIEHIPYIPASYWEWLTTFRYEPDKVEMWLDDNGVFHCEVTDKLYKVTFYEIAILAIYAEVRNIVNGHIEKMDKTRMLSRLKEKIDTANSVGFSFSEFGLRRRFSAEAQDMVVEYIKEHSTTCAGTSNVYLAMKYDMTPCGTFPHEWMMFHAGVFGYKRANYLGLEDWIQVYDGALGTALVDTFTTNSFLRTLTRKQAHLLSGFRQDSGDEYTVGNAIIDRLKELGVDPMSKYIVFSNALDFEKATKIYEYFKDKVKVSFGIGTNLTCDPVIEGYKPANIVMKLSRCRMSNKDPWEKCIKISDDKGKHMGDSYEVEIAKYELHLNDDKA